MSRNPIADFHHHFEPAQAGAPTLLLLHGTGGDEEDLLPLGRSLAPGAALLSPRGRVLENGMPRFFRRLAEGVFDVPDLKRRAIELGDFVEAAVERYDLGRNRIAAVGFSNGANIAAGLLLLRPRLLRAAVLFRPMVPFEPEAPPKLDDVEAFLSAGRHDPMSPPAGVERLAQLLRAAGARVDLAWDPGGHSLEPAAVAAARAWLLQSSLMRSPRADRRER
jgi:phospholipase/carboxylesterase/glyoxalase family protein